MNVGIIIHTYEILLKAKQQEHKTDQYLSEIKRGTTKKHKGIWGKESDGTILYVCGYG